MKMRRSDRGILCALVLLLSTFLLFTARSPDARGAVVTWNQPTGTSWNTDTNWTPTGVPNAVGASVAFNGAATANNPAQTASRTITADASQTVGSINFLNDLSTFSNTISTGITGSKLILDEVNAGPALISVPAAAGTGNNTISVAMTLNDTLVAQVDNITASSAAGALNLTATMSGAGGFTKQGNGLATFGTGAKTYTGATTLSGGRMRISLAALPSATSGFTINSGAQLDLISAGTYAFGSGTMNLNGAGPTAGPFATFPGAIRNDTGLVVTISNAVNLQSDTLLHVQATAGTGSGTSPTGSLTFSNVISGPGKLTLTGPGSNVDQGSLIVNAANTYSGGTLVAGGILEVSGATATLGTGNVTVDNATSPQSIARLAIDAGVTNAIADGKTLSLAGGGTAGTADQNYAILATGVNEVVGGLILGGVPQTQAGTYGSTASAATFQNDEYFSGPGVITLAPEPGAAAVAGVFASASLLTSRRARRRSRLAAASLSSPDAL